jgi:hypothetical protein
LKLLYFSNFCYTLVKFGAVFQNYNNFYYCIVIFWIVENYSKFIVTIILKWYFWKYQESQVRAHFIKIKYLSCHKSLLKKSWRCAFWIFQKLQKSEPVLATGGKVRLRLRFFRIFRLRLGWGFSFGGCG